MNKRYLIFVYYLTLINCSLAQYSRPQGSLSLSDKIDSLLSVLKSVKEDTNKENLLSELSWYLCNRNPDTSIVLSSEELILSEKIKYQRGIGKANHNLGWFYYLKGNYPLALSYDLRALKIRDVLKDKKGTASTLNNIGVVYYNQGNRSKALEYYLMALKISEELQQKNLTASLLCNIGIIYDNESDDLLLTRAEKDSLLNRSLRYYVKAMSTYKEVGDLNGMSLTLDNIGIIYSKQMDYSKALDHFNDAIKIAEEIGDKNALARHLGNIGSLYNNMKNYKQAEVFFLRSLTFSRDVQDLDGQMGINKSLSSLYFETGKYQLAFEYYKKYIVARDSISNEENIKKQTQTEMQYEFDKKQTADSITNVEKINQEELKHEQEIQQQKIYTSGGILGFLLMIIVAGVSFRAYKTKQKANEIISLQKQLVEMKQREILDSIQYAKRIQQSLLPTEKYVHRCLERSKKS